MDASNEMLRTCFYIAWLNSKKPSSMFKQFFEKLLSTIVTRRRSKMQDESVQTQERCMRCKNHQTNDLLRHFNSNDCNNINNFVSVDPLDC